MPETTNSNGFMLQPPTKEQVEASYQEYLDKQKELEEQYKNEPETIPEDLETPMPHMEIKLTFTEEVMREVTKLMRACDNQKIASMVYSPSCVFNENSIQLAFSPHSKDYFDEDGRPIGLIIDWTCISQWFNAISEPYYPWDKAINFAKVYCFNSFKDWFEGKFGK